MDWDHGEWLDRVSVRPTESATHTAGEQQTWSTEAAQLQARAEDLRKQMTYEKSRDRRMDQLLELQEIGDDLRPVQKALQGGPQPDHGHPMPQPGDAGGDGG